MKWNFIFVLFGWNDECTFILFSNPIQVPCKPREILPIEDSFL